MLFKARKGLQWFLLFLSGYLIWQGLFGPQFAPKNLSTMFVWVHYRGILVIGLILMGNLLCMGCPLVLARNILRKISPPSRKWPQQLQNRYPAIFLFCLVLFLYEAFDLWASPFYTAILLIGVFATILLIDGIFTKGTFCKYVCPVGHFNFLGSLFSPFEIKKKRSSVCLSCTTQDCLHGSPQRNGCELDLFMPNKKGNFGCTWCLDCIQACPHDNIGFGINENLHVEKSLSQLSSGLGKLSARRDFQFLVILFCFGAILNAFGMVGPAYKLQIELADLVGWKSEVFTLFVLFVVFLLVAPWFLIKTANKGTQLLSKNNNPNKFWKEKLLVSMIPIGFSIWVAHYLFHFLTGVFTFFPILGISFPVQYMGVPESVVSPIQVAIIFIGLFYSLFLVRNTLASSFKKRVMIPWMTLHFILAIFSIWIMNLPMEMRGTFIGG